MPPLVLVMRLSDINQVQRAGFVKGFMWGSVWKACSANANGRRAIHRSRITPAQRGAERQGDVPNARIIFGKAVKVRAPHLCFV